MTQADSVHSTPPTNTSARHSRRSVLGAIAGSAAAAGSVATLVLPTAKAREPDPIYVVIERHKAAAAVWDVTIDVRANFNDLTMTAEQWTQRDELDEAVDYAWRPCEEAGLDLIGTEPTTLAGIVAAIDYIRIQISDDGTYMPHDLLLDTGGDAQDTIGWVDAFLATIANAAASIEAVQS